MDTTLIIVSQTCIHICLSACSALFILFQLNHKAREWHRSSTPQLNHFTRLCPPKILNHNILASCYCRFYIKKRRLKRSNANQIMFATGICGKCYRENCFWGQALRSSLLLLWRYRSICNIIAKVEGVVIKNSDRSLHTPSFPCAPNKYHLYI